MPHSSHRSQGGSRNLAAQSAEMAWAVPQVIAHRLARMALAGGKPNARDQREFHLMSAEKTAAFNESWAAMGAQMLRAQQSMAVSMMGSWGRAWMGTAPSLTAAWGEMQGAMLGVAAAGLAPVHKRAVANAKRLGTTRLF